jgi:hypothetical protein
MSAPQPRLATGAQAHLKHAAALCHQTRTSNRQRATHGSRRMRVADGCVRHCAAPGGCLAAARPGFFLVLGTAWCTAASHSRSWTRALVAQQANAHTVCRHPCEMQPVHKKKSFHVRAVQRIGRRAAWHVRRPRGPGADHSCTFRGCNTPRRRRAVAAPSPRHRRAVALRPPRHRRAIAAPSPRHRALCSDRPTVVGERPPRARPERSAPTRPRAVGDADGGVGRRRRRAVGLQRAADASDAHCHAALVRAWWGCSASSL